jgi:hypothetical protein
MIVGFTGKMGGGKTYSMTFFGKRMLDKGFSIISNYTLSMKHRLITKEEIQKYGSDSSEMLKDCVLMLDEMQTIMDCRSSQKNRMLTFFVLQTRKRGVNLFYTTQNFHAVDRRLRDNTDFLVDCTALRNESGETIGFGLEILQCHGRDRFESLNHFTLRKSESVYRLYDSYEIVNFSE